MNLNNRALTRAIGIGAGAIFVLSLIAQIPFVGLLCCCLIWLAYIGVGALYPYFAQRDGTPVTGGQAALGGAIAAAVAGLVQGIVSAVASLLFASADTVTQSLQQLEQSGLEVPPEMYDMYANGLGAGVGIAAALVAICFSLVIGAILGAIGGAIYNGVRGNRAPVAPPPPPPAEPPSFDL